MLAHFRRKTQRALVGINKYGVTSDTAKNMESKGLPQEQRLGLVGSSRIHGS